MGINDVFVHVSNKVKIQFKIDSSPSCRLYVHTTLVHPLNLVPSLLDWITVQLLRGLTNMQHWTTIVQDYLKPNTNISWKL